MLKVLIGNNKEHLFFKYFDIRVYLLYNEVKEIFHLFHLNYNIFKCNQAFCHVPAGLVHLKWPHKNEHSLSLFTEPRHLWPYQFWVHPYETTLIRIEIIQMFKQ